ncbi:hypothetical protein [Mangrovibacterium marinum]|uniref:Uncharacterized protein n=1 Tax=Mangrovibacterium marinum TaxID=1639118 RepID=A0A2T5C4E7_9BACT|nr:hypothetical protein [Mangrovibacterium marinum]PTN09734.1 hypothetical protein C8N47_10318 [Mangrovibacterium marinum]
MKRFLLMVVFAALATGLWAQETYKYVIIPTTIPDIGKGLNPYGVSSAIQQSLAQKSIQCMFETAERPADYCDALIVSVEKVNSLLRNKLLLRFKDCTNREVWAVEGTGMSKDFRQGYAEAVKDALKDLDHLPRMKYTYAAVAAQAATPVPQATEKPVVAVAPTKPEVQKTESSSAYQPTNIYFNEKYLVDYRTGEGGVGSLIILNGQGLGYEKLQEIAQIKASDIAGIYSVTWTQPDGVVWNGVAQQSGTELKISVSSGDQKEVINLQKQ